jgi:hypothetical protein
MLSEGEKLISNLLVLSVVSGDASASKPQEVKRLPGGKVKKKVGSSSPCTTTIKSWSFTLDC